MRLLYALIFMLILTPLTTWGQVDQTQLHNQTRAKIIACLELLRENKNTSAYDCLAETDIYGRAVLEKEWRYFIPSDPNKLHYNWIQLLGLIKTNEAKEFLFNWLENKNLSYHIRLGCLSTLLQDFSITDKLRLGKLSLELYQEGSANGEHNHFLIKALMSLQPNGWEQSVRPYLTNPNSVESDDRTDLEEIFYLMTGESNQENNPYDKYLVNILLHKDLESTLQDLKKLLKKDSSNSYMFERFSALAFRCLDHKQKEMFQKLVSDRWYFEIDDPNEMSEEMTERVWEVIIKYKHEGLLNYGLKALDKNPQKQLEYLLKASEAAFKGDTFSAPFTNRYIGKELLALGRWEGLINILYYYKISASPLPEYRQQMQLYLNQFPNHGVDALVMALEALKKQYPNDWEEFKDKLFKALTDETSFLTLNQQNALISRWQFKENQQKQTEDCATCTESENAKKKNRISLFSLEKIINEVSKKFAQQQKEELLKFEAWGEALIARANNLKWGELTENYRPGKVTNFLLIDFHHENSDEARQQLLHNEALLIETRKWILNPIKQIKNSQSNLSDLEKVQLWKDFQSKLKANTPRLSHFVENIEVEIHTGRIYGEQLIQAIDLK